MYAIFTRFVIPALVTVVIACAMLARHNAQEWHRLHEDARYFYRQGLYAESLEAASLSLEKAEGWLGLSARYQADSLNQLALSLDEFGRYGESEAAYRRALALEEKAVGREGNTEYALVLNNFALSCNDQERYAEAEALALEALGIWEQLLGEDRVRALFALAAATSGLEEYQQTVSYARAAVAALEAQRWPDAGHLAVALHWEGDALYTMEDYELAEAPLLRALELYREASPADSFTVTRCLADVYLALGQVDKAEAQHLQMLAFFETLAANDEDSAVGQSLADAPLSAAGYPAANQYDNDGQGAAAAANPANDRDIWLCWALTHCASFYMDIEQPEKAVPQYRRAVQAVERVYGTADAYLVSSLNDLGVACEQSGYYAEAEGAYLRVLGIIEESAEPDTDVLFVVLQNLRDTYEKSGHLRKMADIQKRMHSLTADDATALEPPPSAQPPAG